MRAYYNNPIMQIVTETRRHLSTMNVEHFFSLYKALMIWKREVCVCILQFDYLS